jgi:hypothetical protein
MQILEMRSFITFLLACSAMLLAFSGAAEGLSLFGSHRTDDLDDNAGWNGRRLRAHPVRLLFGSRELQTTSGGYGDVRQRSLLTTRGGYGDDVSRRSLLTMDGGYGDDMPRRSLLTYGRYGEA